MLRCFSFRNAAIHLLERANERPASHSQEIGKLAKYYPGWKKTVGDGKHPTVYYLVLLPPMILWLRLRNVEEDECNELVKSSSERNYFVYKVTGSGKLSILATATSSMVLKQPPSGPLHSCLNR